MRVGSIMRAWRCRLLIYIALPALFIGLVKEQSARADLLADAQQGMARAVSFFEALPGASGSYVWEYSEDLTQRRGEAVVDAIQGWAQPPGTPAVGLAYLSAFAATGDQPYLEAARRTGRALVDTQLESGGWWFLLEFDPIARRAWCYRRGPTPCHEVIKNPRRNATTLDDNTTQGALTFLMLLDAASKESDADIKDAITYGLARLREAQYSNGAWPVRLDRGNDVEPSENVARLPDAWSRDRVRLRTPFYSLNDHMVRDAIRTFLLAHRLYGNPADLETARRAGEFLIAAQLPAPQAGWAQTYNGAMEPVWGRAFEPPAVASRESGGVIEALLELYLYTGDRAFFEPIPTAVDWLEVAQLPDGQWARFYELRTNRPLYMTADYKLTYQTDDLPQHYGFVGIHDIPPVLEHCRQVVHDGRAAFLRASRSPLPRTAKVVRLAQLADAVTDIISDLDGEGRWLEDGTIRSATFVANIKTLAAYVAFARGWNATDWHELRRIAEGLSAMSEDVPLRTSRRDNLP